MDPTLHTTDQVDENYVTSLKFAYHQAVEYNVITPRSTKARMGVMLRVTGDTGDPVDAIASSPLGGILLGLMSHSLFLDGPP